MVLLLGDYSISTLVLNSKIEAEKVASSYTQGFLQIGDFYLSKSIHAIKVAHHFHNSTFGIIVCLETTIPPTIIQIDGERIIIGCNSDLICLDLISLKCLFKKELNGIFFYAKYQNSKIIVVTEIGVEVYGRDGDIIKKIPTDLITSFHFTPLSLDCQTDSGIVTINLM